MLIFASSVVIIALILASLEDLRSREVPDWLSFALMFLGIGSSLIYSISLKDYSFILNSIAGFIVCILIGYLMFYSSQWGGGDSKLLMGIGAIIGLDITRIGESPLLILLVNILLIGAVYGLFWSLGLAIFNPKKFSKSFKEHFYSDKVTLLRKMALGAAVLLFIIIATSPFYLKVALFTLMIIMFCILYLWVFVKSVEESCMIVDMPVKKLTEGDWVVKDVIVKGKKICSPKDLGLKKEQIDELKKLKVKKITIKQGIPFVPSFLLAFIAALTWGAWFLRIV